MLSTSDELIWDIWLSQYWLPCVRAAGRVGIFEELAARPAGCPELASRLELDERVLGAVLHLLGTLELLNRTDGVYGAAPHSATYLLPEEPAYWGPALAIGPPSGQEEAILKGLREGTESATGAPGPDGVPRPGQGSLPVVMWAGGAVDGERARGIGQVMHSHSVFSADGLARALSLPETRRVLDVGGGSGCFSVALCRHHPNLFCTVMELEGMCPVAQRYIEEAGLSSRIDTAACNMFAETWPGGADAVLFSNVLHDWRPVTGEFLLRKAFEVLPPGGRVLVHEMLLDKSGRVGAAFSLMMVLGTQGRQFTSARLQDMLVSAGFQDVRVRPAAGRYSLVSGRKR